MTPWTCGAPVRIHHTLPTLKETCSNWFAFVTLYSFDTSALTRQLNYCNFIVLCCLIPSFLCMTGLFLYLSMMDFLSRVVTDSGTFADAAIWLRCVPRSQSNLILSKTCPTNPTSHDGSYYLQNNSIMPCQKSY